MADTDARQNELAELIEKAEGYLSDAEFREDMEMRQVRYLQAMTTLLLANARQNEAMIELLRKAQV
ncbi:MAG: hypothetical protein GXY85_12495 [Candidatus Brocadiaceae bacterium]|nr:hypothetical protein [Candidatus Brocadiaceae bacterium]